MQRVRRSVPTRWTARRPKGSHAGKSHRHPRARPHRADPLSRLSGHDRARFYRCAVSDPIVRAARRRGELPRGVLRLRLLPGQRPQPALPPAASAGAIGLPYRGLVLFRSTRPTAGARSSTCGWTCSRGTTMPCSGARAARACARKSACGRVARGIVPYRSSSRHSRSKRHLARRAAPISRSTCCPRSHRPERRAVVGVPLLTRPAQRCGPRGHEPRARVDCRSSRSIP